MADDPQDKTPEAIKKHKVQHTFEMRTPGGSAIRRGEAEKLIYKDHQAQNSDRAAQYAKLEKAEIATTRDMENGTRGLLSKEFNKASKEKDIDR